MRWSADHPARISPYRPLQSRPPRASSAVSARTHLVAGGTENWVPGTIEQLAEHLVSSGLVTADDIESVLALTADPSCHYAPSSMVTAWGQRPA